MSKKMTKIESARMVYKMNSWKDFAEQTPKYGEVIVWRHYQALLELPEVLVFDRGTEWIEGDGWISLEFKPKRHPDTNGVLPLTEKELEEFSKFWGGVDVHVVETLHGTAIWAYGEYKQKPTIPNVSAKWNDNVNNYKAILYLANLFELGGVK